MSLKRWMGRAAIAASLIALIPSCKPNDGAPGAAGTPAVPAATDTILLRFEDLPGLVIAITAVEGASGADGSFRVGDLVKVTFTIKKDDGTDLPIGELDSGSIYVSGPTFNYQRVLERKTDLETAAVLNSNGSYSYTFADRIPATYMAPYNDTTSLTDGELQGQALLAGTYTVGIQAYKIYTVDGTDFRDVANVTEDFLFGGATTLSRREVVKVENCNQCHSTLQAHGGSRRDTKLCVLCHTAGSEDRNVAAAAGGTPGATVEFGPMIHKIHNGAHLPSVLGVSTLGDGTRNYAATPAPYQLVGFGDSVNDFSGVQFPAWPNLSDPMPRDAGYTALTAAQKSTDDGIRRGVTNCALCHGDPDGAGPLTAPAQGGLATMETSRRACGSCHDDINWNNPYTANGQTMPTQLDDSGCATCHVGTNDSLDTINAHLHPVVDPALNPGLNVTINSISPTTGSALDPGEKLAVNLSITEDNGDNATPVTEIDTLYVVIAGPTNNRQLVHYMTMPIGVLGTTAAASYSFNVPQPVVLEFLGDATGAAETKTSSRTPFWSVSGATTTIRERTATGAGSVLTAAAVAGQTYVDVAAGGTFAATNFVVIDDGTGSEEYLQIMGVIGNRVYFGTTYSPPAQPFVRVAHAAGAAITKVTLTTKTVTTHYSLTNSTGSVNLVAGGFTAGNAVLASYTTDFVMPAVYPPALNDSPDLNDSWGKWANKAIEAGTYTLGIWARRSITVTQYSESVTYRAPSLLASGSDFLVGTASTIEPYDLISSADNCSKCHTDELKFHGGSRRGAGTCLLCHGTHGAEDNPKFRNPGAPATTGVVVQFKNMLHKIHMGEELTNAATYTVSGNAGSVHTYEEVVFPAMPGGVKHCDMCHGTSDAWKEPTTVNHSTAQILPNRVWRTACTSCHDSDATAAHANAMTDGTGAESCAVCHGEGKEFNVELMHKNR